MQRHCKDPSALPTVSSGPSSLGTEGNQGTKGPIACQVIGEAQSHARSFRLPGSSGIHQLCIGVRNPKGLAAALAPSTVGRSSLDARILADESSAAPAFLDLSLATRKLRLRRAKRPARVARGAWCSRGSIRPRQSSLTFSRPRANRGLTPWHRCAAATCGLEPLLTKYRSGLADFPEPRPPRVPHIAAAVSQVPSLPLAVWARQEQEGPHDRKRSVLEPQLWGSRPLLITQHQVEA